MLPVFIIIPFLLTAAVTGRPHDLVNSTILEQHAQNASSPVCDAACTAFAAVKNCHGVPHCGCSNRYLQAQGGCLICKTSNPQDAAAVQFFLDAEVNQCHEEGIPINFRLQLPPDAQVIVDKVNRDSARLRHQQTAFLALQIAGGHVGLVIVLILSCRFRRHPTFLNFCITWIFSSVVYSLMLYRGTRGNTVANSLGFVSPNKCLLQASLTNGAQVMTACSTMALVIQLWIGLRAGIHGDLSYGPKQKRGTTLVLLAFPYVLFFAFATTSVFVGKRRTIVEDVSWQRASPANFYCSIIELKPFLQAIYGITLGLLIVTAVFDALIIAILYHNWWALRHIQLKSGVSLSMLLRVVIFSIFRVAVAVAYGIVLDMPPRHEVLQSGSGDPLWISFNVPIWVELLEASIPLIGFLVLGVNRDMLTSLMFWRRNRRYMETMQTINITSGSGPCTVETWNEQAVMNASTKCISAKV